MKCNTCQNERYCSDGNHELTRYGCTNNGFAAYVPQTNADRIRGMTDEELADRIMGYIRCEACEREFHIECNPLMTCRGVWLDWLKSPVEVDNG